VRPTIYLFDIDGTILLTGGAGRRAFERAFQAVTGRGDACTGFSFGGMTDKAIVRQALSSIARGVDEAITETLFTAYLEALHDEVARTENYQIMPGVRRVVEALRGRESVAVGLGTGNLKRGAEVKLKRGDLWHLFDFGGFGCDAEDRVELLRLGAERGATQLGLPAGECRVVVIGDTLRDIDAARGIGAECLAVATGGVAVETLRAGGAHAVFETLEADGVMEMLITR
jgi:phosphoglycolate phosphatase-like HAD superfamily hydrolase